MSDEGERRKPEHCRLVDRAGNEAYLVDTNTPQWEIAIPVPWSTTSVLRAYSGDRIPHYHRNGALYADGRKRSNDEAEIAEAIRAAWLADYAPIIDSYRLSQIAARTVIERGVAR